MLKYSIKINDESTQQEIIFDELHVSKDLSYVNGVASSDYQLSDGDFVLIKSIYTNAEKKVQIGVENVVRQGFIMVGDDEKVWVEDGKVTIDDISYEVEWNKSVDECDNEDIYDPYPIETYDGKKYNIINFDKKENVTKFHIQKGSGETLDVQSAFCVSSGITKNEWSQVPYSDYLNIVFKGDLRLFKNDFIRFDMIAASTIKSPVLGQETSKYVILNGNKYKVEKDLIKTIKFTKFKDVNDGTKDAEKEYLDTLDSYELYKIDDNNYVVTVLGTDVFINLDGDIAKWYGTYKEGENTILFGEKTYLVDKHDGVEVDGNLYRVEKFETSFIENYDNEDRIAEYVEVNQKYSYRLKVVDVLSTNTVRCRPYSNDENDDVIKESFSGICANIQNDLNNFSITLEDITFGIDEKNKIGVGDLQIYKLYDYVSVPLSLDIKTSNNISQEFILDKDFLSIEEEKSINRIVDMERDIYYPSCCPNSNTEDPKQNFEMVSELEFNLHFRTRDLESWKIIEDDGVEANSGRCNWFITDCDLYEGLVDEQKKLTSDLLYFLGFTDDDVFYQKSKIGKSFLRLSFYDSPYPKTQSLLYTSTIFMNEGKLYKDYINNVKNGQYVEIDVPKPITSGDTATTVDESEKEYVSGRTISVSYEPYSGNVISSDNLLITGYSHNDFTNNDLINNKRLSSIFSVKNRYEDDTSSEGFYLYLFKEYSTNLRPRKIYMKAEFNHAGYGRTIPFMMPVEIKKDEKTEVEEVVGFKSISEFIEGFPLSEIYRQMFIELNVIYDAVNQRYVYYLPEKLNEQMFKMKDTEDKKMVFNLFEIKIKNEDNDDEQKGN